MHKVFVVFTAISLGKQANKKKKKKKKMCEYDLMFTLTKFCYKVLYLVYRFVLIMIGSNLVLSLLIFEGVFSRQQMSGVFFFVLEFFFPHFIFFCLEFNFLHFM